MSVRRLNFDRHLTVTIQYGEGVPITLHDLEPFGCGSKAEQIEAALDLLRRTEFDPSEEPPPGEVLEFRSR